MAQENKKDNTGYYWAIGGVFFVMIVLVAILINNARKQHTPTAAGTNPNTPAPSTNPIVNQVKITLEKATNFALNTAVKSYPLASVSNPVNLYTTDGNFNISYSKTVPGQFVGVIVGDHIEGPDPYGTNFSYYKVVNSSGKYLYVLKSKVVKQ